MNHCITSKNFIIIVISTKCVHVQLVDRLVGSFCKGSPWHVLFRVAFIGFSFQSLIWRDGVKEGKRSYHYYVPCYILLLFRLYRVYSLQRTKRKTKIMIIKRVSFHHNSSNYIHIYGYHASLWVMDLVIILFVLILIGFTRHSTW